MITKVRTVGNPRAEYYGLSSAVIAYAFENEPRTIVRSFIPGKLAIESGFAPSYSSLP